ncbi:MAG: 2-C-methyl-D-erythritol 4-phosphate cytidylyltransferase [Candidatus Omnitrophica bacterium]|nr:2-C-methyl-D-erythritol 4-phosphate cytidylyltransferase [Candidatus Omnitrophota bacterium]
MKIQAIIPAAGLSERMKAQGPKVLLEIAGRPVLVHTLAAFEDCPVVDSVILVGHEDSLKDLTALVKAAGLKKISVIVAGGATRTQSVRNGLKALAKDTDIVLVHDGARPLVTRKVIEDGIAIAGECGAAVAAVPVKPTLKVVDPRTNLVSETLDRTLVWEIQTPQVFRREIIERAYRGDENATDDAALVEKSGVPVRVYRADYRNIKITTPEDMVIAQAFLRG